MKTKISGIASLLTCVMLAIGMAACGQSNMIRQDEERAVYRYKIRVYYLDGGSRERTFLTKASPYIATGHRSIRGCGDGFPRLYWERVETYGKYRDNGACRFEVLYKKDVSEEYYKAKIISTRKTPDGCIIHKLDRDKKKGGGL